LLGFLTSPAVGDIVKATGLDPVYPPAAAAAPARAQ